MKADATFLSKDIRLVLRFGSSLTFVLNRFATQCYKAFSMQVRLTFYIVSTLQTTSCLLQREVLSYPISTLDILLRLQLACLDIASIRLLYFSRIQLNKAICKNT